MDLYTDMTTDQVGAEIASDLQRRATVILDSLCMAFGGRSQVTPDLVGRAIAGQIYNNGLTVHGTVDELVEAVLSQDAWSLDLSSNEYEDDYLTAASACRAACGKLGVDWLALPGRPYIRPRGGY